MPCYYPRHGWRSREKNENGKKPITFNHKDGDHDLPQTVPCGQCIGCRLENSRQWAVRCYHEASLYDDNCFITLTYNDDHIPLDGSLHFPDFQNFMKRLRKKYAPKKIRFFHCGEYGDETFRPHYHALLFNHDFQDKKHYQTSNEHRLYKSDELNDLWSHPVTNCYMGDALIGNLTFDSAAYTARYALKKITGEKSYDYYDGLTPEYATMSRRPGLGATWLKKYHSDIYPLDYVIVNGQKMLPPNFYDTQYEKLQKNDDNLKTLSLIKGRRKQKSRLHLDDNTDWRLKTKEQVKLAQTKYLTRTI